MKKFLLISFMLVFVFAITPTWAQERTISGTITSAEDGSSLPGVNVILKGSATGTVTDINGNYRLAVPSDGGTLVFSFVGLETKEVAIGSQSTIDVNMVSDVTELSEVVVTALGIERETRTITYASQEVEAEDLNITQDTDIKTALAGKVAGIQLDGQAGSKLNSTGKIRIRGAISLTADDGPLYVVDGVPTPDATDVDMNSVASINILKGPNATALYGQRAEAGVVVITTKKGSKDVSVELYSSTIFDKVAYLPKYQNLYGQGYSGEDSFGLFDFSEGDYPAEWSALDGERYLISSNNYADESWGPKFNGEDYVPWYAWWPDSPYFGETRPYVAQPDNIKDFYQTGVTKKNTIALSGGSDRFNARLAYTNLDQKGITPYTGLMKHYINANMNYNATEKLSITTNIRYTNSTIKGDFDDGYGNQTSGSFNSWFGRQIEVSKLEELQDLTTFNGYSASWNWWGPEGYATGGGKRKPAFWFNPYTFLKEYDQTRVNNNYTGSLTADYKFTENWALSVTGSRNQTEYRFEYQLPFFISNSAAPELYNAWSNSFGEYERTEVENNFSAVLNWNKRFGEIDITAFAGGNIRKNSYNRFLAQMPVDAKSGGLIIPDVFTFSNAGIVPTPEIYEYDKQVNSIYGNLSLGYRDMLYLDASYRRDWSSALPANKNGYGYPSIGASFIFTELMDDNNVLSFGKLRGGWAQVGNDVDALRINQVYGTAAQPFMGTNVIMNTPTTVVDPNLKPSLNTSVEAGLDLKFVKNRIGLSFTYYNENREDEIIPISISRGSGYDKFLTNAGKSSREGVEISLDADIFKATDGFSWNLMFNFAKNSTVVDALPADLTAITGTGGNDAFGFAYMIHELGDNWGQIRGTGYARDDNGNKILQDNGLYKTKQDQYFGSVLPDFTGGIFNRLSYKGLSLVASIDFQKGGKFFSLSEMWGSSSGLMEATAAINENGKNVRDDVDDGGGVRVTGVTETGEAVDTFVDGYSYFTQFYGNRLAEEYIHNASYIKLREVSLSYDLSRFLANTFIRRATISVVGRNLGLLAVSDDNVNRWDPSELAQTYGENGQLPGTQSYGFNIQVTF